jgi:hypothetical protein
MITQTWEDEGAALHNVVGDRHTAPADQQLVARALFVVADVHPCFNLPDPTGPPAVVTAVEPRTRPS